MVIKFNISILYYLVHFFSCTVLSPSPQGEGLGVRLNNLIFKNLPHPNPDSYRGSLRRGTLPTATHNHVRNK